MQVVVQLLSYTALPPEPIDEEDPWTSDHVWISYRIRDIDHTVNRNRVSGLSNK
jgi:hypothetical protein